VGWLSAGLPDHRVNPVHSPFRIRHHPIHAHQLTLTFNGRQSANNCHSRWIIKQWFSVLIPHIIKDKGLSSSFRTLRFVALLLLNRQASQQFNGELLIQGSPAGETNEDS
jgi:hypothetical protein